MGILAAIGVVAGVAYWIYTLLQNEFDALFPTGEEANEKFSWDDIDQWPTCGRRSKEPFSGTKFQAADYNETNDRSDGSQGPLIVDGSGPANKGEYPWFVMIYKGAKTICNGALINSQWILTAAQCCDDFTNDGTISATIGAIKTNDITDGTRVFIEDCYKHPYYYKDYSYLSADIALMKMKDNLTQPNEGDYSKYNSLCLPEFDQIRSESLYEIAGTGLTDDMDGKEGMADVLQKGLIKEKPSKCVDVDSNLAGKGPYECYEINKPMFPRLSTGDIGSAMMWRDKQNSRVYTVSL